MVFGTFDRVHEGHRHFLNEAKKLGDILIAIVAPDEHVRRFKHHAPRFTLDERIHGIQKENIADFVQAGDEMIGSWSVVFEHEPDVIALGYDQDGLGSALEDVLSHFPKPVEIVKMKAYKPEIYRSGLLNK